MEKYADFINNEYISGNVKQSGIFYEISFTVLKNIKSHYVYRAYFLEKHSTNLINIGVIEINGQNGLLKFKCDYGKDTVVIFIKDTYTEKLTFITCAFFEESWNVKGYLDGSDIHLKINSIFSDINLALSKYEKTDDGYYKITDFSPLTELSSVKCALFERNVNYAFDKHGYYLFKIDNNVITIGIKPIERENPFLHLNDFSYTEDGIYYTKIALEEDGQYFIKQ